MVNIMLIIRNAAHLIKNADQTLTNVDILVKDGCIAQIGANLHVTNSLEINAEGCIVAPGFHNLHTHLYQSFLKGMRDDLPLVEWCEEVTFPFVGAAQSGEIDRAELFYSFGIMGAIEQLKSGITAFVDMDMSHSSLNKAWQDLGIRGTLAVQTANAWIPEHLRRSDEAQLESLRRCFERTAPFSLTSTSIAPSTPFCCTPEYLRALSKLAEETDKRIYIHVSETEREVQESLRDTGMTPLEYLDSLGVVNDRMTIVHCCHLTEKEMSLAKERGVAICHCPVSNMKLADGIAPIKKFIDLGIPVTLGTDGAASNDRLDMFSEMRASLQLAKLYAKDAAALTAKDAFYIATEGGAKAMGLSSGVLEVGRPADFIIIDTFAPNMTPCHNPINTLVWCAGPENIRDVVINGEVVFSGGKPVKADQTALMKKAIQLEDDCRSYIARQTL